MPEMTGPMARTFGHLHPLHRATYVRSPLLCVLVLAVVSRAATVATAVAASLAVSAAVSRACSVEVTEEAEA